MATVVITQTINRIVISASGPAGAIGPGVPIGGTVAQVLSKIDGTNFNTQWVTNSATVATLNNVGNVTIAGIASNELLKWNGSAWVNNTLAEAGVSAVGHTHTESDITDLLHTDADAVHDNVASEISAVALKGTPVSGDFILIEDSAAANVKKRITVGSLPAGAEVNDLTVAVTWANVPDANITVGSVTQHEAALTITESQISDLSHSVATLNAIGNVTITAIGTGEILKWNGSAWVNNTLAEAGIASISHTHAAADITSGTFVDARVAESNVTQHETALIITESQISDLSHSVATLNAIGNVTITAIGTGEILKWNGSSWINNTLAEADISATGHTHVEADITDLQSYLLNITAEPLSDLSDVTITGVASGEILKWSGSAWINNTLAEAGIAAVGHTHTTIKSKSITIEDPTSSEDLSMFFTNVAITITEIRAVLVGSATPSVTWTIRHGTDRNAVGAEVVTGGTVTTSTTTGSDVTSFNDDTIVVDSFVWLETTAQSGTVGELSITIIYTED